MQILQSERRARHAPRIAVVVPAFNEASLIARTLSSIPSYVHDVVVVDDASLDDTAVLVKKLDDARVHLVRHAQNEGVGAAIATGYRVAFERGADVCAVMAGDGQMHPDDLATLLLPILRGEADYVKGDRLSYPGVHRYMPWTRMLGNFVLALGTRAVTGLTVHDSQCGYTALSREAAEQLPLQQLWARYGYPNDLLGMLAQQACRVAEVTVRPVYADEQSGVRLYHAVFVVPYVLLRVLARRLLGTALARLPGSEVPLKP